MSAALLYPVLVQIALTFALLFWMGSARVAALRRGDVKMRDIALGQRAWPERATQIANCFHNQLELPLLFFVLVALAIATRKADAWMAGLAWLFVALRLAHATVHTTSNRVTLRFQIYVAGALTLVLMWGLFALRVLADGA